MDIITTVLGTFAAGLIGSFAVALIIGLLGKKPDYESAVALAVGVTVPVVVRLVWPISHTTYSAILAVSVGRSLYCGQLISRQRTPNRCSKRTREKPRAAKLQR